MTTANTFDLLITEVKSRVATNPESLDSYLTGLGFSKSDRLYVSYVAALAASNEKLQDKFLLELRTLMGAGFFTSNAHVLEVARRDFVDAFEMRALSEIARQTSRTADEIVGLRSDNKELKSEVVGLRAELTGLRADISPLVKHAVSQLPKPKKAEAKEVETVKELKE